MWLSIILASVTAGLRRIGDDRRGAVALIVAFALPILVGVCGLAIDASIWAGAKNNAQGAADSAALSAVIAKKANGSSTQIQAEAFAVAALNGFQNGANGVAVTLNNPPVTGSYTSNANAYEVIITQKQNLFFSRMFGAAPTVRGRAVALLSITSAPCVLALDTSAAKSINMSGGSTSINATNCNINSNSSSPVAVSLSGGASINAAGLYVSGDYVTSGGSTVNANAIQTEAAATADPYSTLSVPAYSGCNQTNYSLSGGSASINAGVYCGGISVSGGGALTLNPGVYIIDGGNLTVSSSTLTGTGGVSIVVTSSTGSWGKITVSGGSTFNVTAPSSGAMQGVALYMDRSAPTNISDTISGGSTQTIAGAIYIPSQLVTYSGGSGNAASSCLQLIARLLTFSGGSSFGQNCGSLVVPGFQGGGKTGVPVE